MPLSSACAAFVLLSSGSGTATRGRRSLTCRRAPLHRPPFGRPRAAGTLRRLGCGLQRKQEQQQQQEQNGQVEQPWEAAPQTSADQWRSLAQSGSEQRSTSSEPVVPLRSLRERLDAVQRQQSPDESAPEERRRPLWLRLLHDERWSDLRIFLGSFIIATAVRTFVVEPRYIPSLSMFPTFQVGDQLLVEKVSHRFGRAYRAGDVVVFQPPEALAQMQTARAAANQKPSTSPLMVVVKPRQEQLEAMIKRIVAVGGDTIQVRGGEVLVNGVALDEPYVLEEPDYEWGPVRVPPDHLVVLGDNRSNSMDSHIWGVLPERNVIGRALVRYWPPNRVGGIEH